MSKAPASQFEFAALEEAKNYRAAIAELFAPHLKGDVLEVGAGIGQIFSEVSKTCSPKSLAAVEPDPCFVAELRKNFPRAEIWHGLEQDIPVDRNFDAIYSVNVLEHIADDTTSLQCWHQRLRRSGVLCLLVPARPELYSAIDRDFGHYRRYEMSELKRKLTQAGFVSSEVKYFNFAGYFAWFVNFKILGRRSFDRSAVRTFDRLVFPLCHYLEKKVGVSPFGQSLIAIAKR